MPLRDFAWIKGMAHLKLFEFNDLKNTRLGKWNIHAKQFVTSGQDLRKCHSS